MQDALTIYFNGEKYAGLLLAGVATSILIAAIVMSRSGTAFRPFAITLGVFALAQIALGAGLYLRTGRQVARLETQLGTETSAFYVEEMARMTRVQRNFVVIEYIELVVIIVSALTAVALKSRPLPLGIALGLLVTASVVLAFDLFAERRGAEYVAALARGGGSS